MARIFISYRRADSIVYAKLINDKLSDHFGSDDVFMDKEQIDLGDDFARIIDRKVRSCSVLLAVIGPDWLTATDDKGRVRISQPDDYVRHEIASAIAGNIQVVPVLVGGARIPAANELPPDIASLSGRNAHEVRDSSLEQDIDTLIAVLAGERKGFRQAFDSLSRRLRLRKVAMLLVPAVVLLTFFVAWMNLFDYFTLDTKVESYTMWLGDMFSESMPASSIALVVISRESEDRIGKRFDRTWRREHARVIDVLSRAGAKVIAFDMFFREPGEFDSELTNAVLEARQRGSAVLFGTHGGRSSLPGLDTAATGLGHTCAGTRLGYATTVPLVIFNENRRLPSISLLTAFEGGIVEDIDPEHGQIILRTPAGPLRRIGFSHEETVSGPQRNCGVMDKGDNVTQFIIRFNPVRVWREAPRRYRYEDLITYSEALKEQFGGRIVLVGRESDSDIINIRRGFSSEERYGFEVHADIVDTLLQGVRIHPLGQWGQFLIMLCMGVLGALPRFLKQITTGLRRQLYFLAVAVSYIGLIVILYRDFQALLNPLYHIGAFFLSWWIMGKAARRIGP